TERLAHHDLCPAGREGERHCRHRLRLLPGCFYASRASLHHVGQAPGFGGRRSAGDQAALVAYQRVTTVACRVNPCTGCGTKPLTLALSHWERGQGSMPDERLLPRDSARPRRGAAGEYSPVSLSPRANTSCRTAALGDEPAPAVCVHCPLRFLRWSASA